MSGYGVAGRVTPASVIRSEWTKLVSVRSVRWTAAALIVVTLGLSILVCAVIGAHFSTLSASDQLSFDPVNQSLSGIGLGEIVLSALGCLVITGEYASGSIRSTLAAVPNRSLMLAGKAAMLFMAAAVLGIVLSVVSFLAGQAVLGSAPKASLGDAGVLRVLLLTGVGLALIALIGLALGALIRNSAGSIVAAVVVLLVLPIALSPIPGNWEQYAPAAIMSDSLGSVQHASDSLSPGVGLLMLAVYAVVLLVLGGVVLNRRDA